ncbi:hypothetical protein CLOM_g18628 [Closterium sp. NIES-68]|nr:hypothetical protein CLOM_g18628 [Closterium sp. NIES-68]GJP86120.1 hypothetical protein CLOP_g16185 [Closterium sp. NIES-67]
MDSDAAHDGVDGDKTHDNARPFQVVVAATPEMGIGQGGQLPWTHLQRDMAFFKDVTSSTSRAGTRNAVLMGRRTWESLPPRFRPLPGRLNVVLTRSGQLPATSGDGGGGCAQQDVVVAESLAAALLMLGAEPHKSSIESVFVIGGGQVFREALSSPLCEAVHLTRVRRLSSADPSTPAATTGGHRGVAEGEELIPCDTHMPAVDPSAFRLWRASSPFNDNGYSCSFLTYVRASPPPEPNPPASSSLALPLAAVAPCQGNGMATAAVEGGSSSKSSEGRQVRGEGAWMSLPVRVREEHEEYQYLKLVRRIMDDGVPSDDRTGTGTLSLFGCQMRFNLRHTFPLLTTKRVFWRAVVEELLWFIHGSTNAKLLQDKGIHIWDGNASRPYLDSLGLTDREEGDLGPVYGFQWRHFGARYRDMHAEYSGQGVDQLADVIHRIKTNPSDRRILMSAWNPTDIPHMALPPCHVLAQFYVARGELSCQLYQRSCDMGLGVPFNIASYSLLTLLIASVCGLQPGEFVHVLGDAHVYSNHIDPLKLQLQNTPRPFPRVRINPAVADIDSFTAADIDLVGYNPHAKISMRMAV